MLYGEITRQHLKLINEHVVADTIDYLEAQFAFSEDWDGLEKWVHSAKDGEVYDIRLTDDCIRKEDHLNLSAGIWKVYLHGNEFSGGKVIERITTNAAILKVEPTGTLDGEPFPEMPASVTEQILARLEEIERNGGSGAGSGTVKSVARVAPDESGDVPLTPADIGAVEVEITDEEVNVVTVSGTASVGQTIVVEKLDDQGRPVMWRSADFPSGGSSVEVDTTLSQSGKAADAKAVGERFAEQSEAIADQGKTIPKVYDWANAELPFTESEISDTVTGAGFVVNPTNYADGKTYFRYHAGSKNFTWTNPNPQKGSLTITMRGYSQHSGTLSTKIVTVYTDGTDNSLTNMMYLKHGETVTYTTDPDKTVAYIRGNYDFENWVLLDVSVLSIVADYPAPTGTVKSVNGNLPDENGNVDIDIPGGGGGSGGTDIALGISGATVGQIARITAVDDSGVPTVWGPADWPGDVAAEEWKLLFDAEIAEEVNTINTGFWAIPQKKILIILDTLAASANTSYTPVTVYTGSVDWNRNIRFYTSPVPTTAANRSVICIETLGEGRVKVEHSVAPAYTGNGAVYGFHSQNCAVKSMIWNPTDGYGNAINDHITGVGIHTYATFAVGTKMKVYGVRA